MKDKHFMDLDTWLSLESPKKTLGSNINYIKKNYQQSHESYIINYKKFRNSTWEHHMYYV